MVEDWKLFGGRVTSQFSAADAALGYLYQVRVALLHALRRLKKGADFSVSLETLDDVTFEERGDPAELLQVKHHRSRRAGLGDTSADLWKTLRIWFEGRRNGSIPDGARLVLLTTATAAPGTAATCLRASGRDVEAAARKLEAAAQSSRSMENAAAYSLFLATAAGDRRAILDAVVLVDGEPTIEDLDGELRGAVFYAAEREHLGALLQRLEGWWFRRAVRQLVVGHIAGRILSEEIESEMSDLREQFKLDALPIDEDLLDFYLDDESLGNHTSSTFVRQLNLITAGKRRIAAAIRDYYRAFEQRSRWLREELLLVGELGRYEKRLVEEWELVFEAMRDELGEEAAEEAKTRAARSVLEWAERTPIPIRQGVTEPFVCRGSLHMLANEVRIGWHPEFRERLKALLVGMADAGT